MGNLIKSRLFELKRVSLLRTTFISTIALMVIYIFLYKSNEEQLDFDTFVSGHMGTILSLSLIFVGIVTIFVCINDYLDKTVNFCVLNGFTRKQVYFSRVILSEIIGIVSFLVIGVICVLLSSIAYSGEHSISIYNLLVRVLLCAFPMFRIISEVIFFSFLIKNAYVVEVALIAMVINLSAYMEFVTNHNIFILGVNGISGLCNMVEYSTYRVSDRNTIYVFNTDFDVKKIVMLMVVSIVVGMFFIMLGYGFHKEEDYDGCLMVKGE